MRLSMKEWLFMEDEIVNSMNVNHAQALVQTSYQSAKANRITARTLQLRVRRQVIQGFSDYQTMGGIEDALHYKRYIMKNSHIYGDYNENKIPNTKTK